MNHPPSLDGLFNEQHHLQLEECRIRQRLTEINQQIHYLLMRHAQMEIPGKRPATIISEKTTASHRVHSRGGSKQRRQWFARGEAIQLMRQVLKDPMRPAQLVHAVMDAKGYAGDLSSAERKKVEAALHQAIINAVKTKALVKDVKGFVKGSRGATA